MVFMTSSGFGPSHAGAKTCVAWVLNGHQSFQAESGVQVIGLSLISRHRESSSSSGGGGIYSSTPLGENRNSSASQPRSCASFRILLFRRTKSLDSESLSAEISPALRLRKPRGAVVSLCLLSGECLLDYAFACEALPRVDATRSTLRYRDVIETRKAVRARSDRWRC